MTADTDSLPAETPLDHAHAAMQADLGDDAARLRFYERLADGELFLLLKEEAVGESLNLELFELDKDAFVLVFDREDRLAAFAEGPAPYGALPGRVIAEMLAGQNIGLGVNLGVAPSSILIPAEAMSWLAETPGQCARAGGKPNPRGHPAGRYAPGATGRAGRETGHRRRVGRLCLPGRRDPYGWAAGLSSRLHRPPRRGPKGRWPVPQARH